MAQRRCEGTTKKGHRCKAPALPDSDRCIAHSPKETQESLGFGGSQAGAGRPRNPRAVQVLRERLEAEIDEWLEVLLDGRDAKSAVLVGRGEDAYVELVPDHQVRLTAFREAFDRAFGRPRQAVEHSGRDGGVIPVEASFDFGDEKTRALAHELLERRVRGAGGP